MSGATVRVPYEEAKGIAYELVQLLQHSCRSLHIAGSIRRGKLDIGDIDIVCQPLQNATADLFGLPDGTPVDLLHDRCDELVANGTLTKRLDVNGRPSWGHALKRAVYRGLAVDIQSVTDPDTWGMWMVIRTGPSSWNKRLVTPQRKGGLLPAGCEVKDGFKLYRWGERIPTPTELSVFEAFGIEYLRPWDRG